MNFVWIIYPLELVHLILQPPHLSYVNQVMKKTLAMIYVAKTFHLNYLFGNILNIFCKTLNFIAFGE
jgi:hypothetical protein